VSRAAGGRPPVEDATLVLRRFPYGESSLVVQVLTRHHGRLSLLAKGAYRPRSGYCGVLDLFDTLLLGWRMQRLSDLGLVTRGSITTRRRGIVSDLGLYRAGLAVLELAGIGAREGEPDVALYELTEGVLDVLAAGKTEADLVVAAFDLRFLATMGLTPALVSCASCGRNLSKRGRNSPSDGGTAPFSNGAGGRLCPPCAEDARSHGRRVDALSTGILRIAQSLLETPTENLPRLRIAPRVTDEVRSFTQRFLEYHLETRPRSRRKHDVQPGTDARSPGPRPTAPPR